MDPTIAPPDASAGTPAALPSSAPPPARPESGPATTPAAAHRQISGYEVLELVGAGGMGVVYRARQHRPNRLVALKLMRATALAPAQLRRFEYEAEVLGRLQHEGIARIFEAGVDATTGQPFFAMELVEGERLDVYVARANPDQAARLRLLARICQAVHYAHAKGVVHRDLKPGNIMVTPDGQPKILDFGVARLTDADRQAATLHTETGVIVGTLAYMSPEQAAGAHAEVDTRADVYALGVIAYELLSGRLPLALAGRPLPAAVRAIIEEEPSRLSSADRGLRGDLETIVGKALAKEKQQRYDSAAALAEDVRRFLDYEPITARRPSTWYNLRKFARRNKAVVGGVAAVFVVLLAGAVTSTAFAVRASRQAALAEQRRGEAVAAGRGEAQQRLEADQKRAEAEAAYADSQAVNEFLTHDLLGSADPAVHRGDKLTVEAALDNAARMVGIKFGDRPRIEATVRNTLGATYFAIGRSDVGLPHARAALDLRRTALGQDHPDTLTSVNNLAALLEYQGNFADAEPLYREGLDKSRRVLGENHPDTLSSINNMAYVLHAQGKLGEAEPLYREALDKSRRVMGEDHPDTLGSVNNMGLLLLDQGKLGEAEPLYREGSDKSRRVLGEDHPDTLTSINNLGLLLQSQGRLKEAEPLQRDVMEKSRQVLGGDHPDTLNAVGNMGFLLQAQGRLTEAEPLLREALDKRRKVLGADHPLTLTSINNVGFMLMTQGRAAEAAPLLAELYQRAASAQISPTQRALYFSMYGPNLTALRQHAQAEEPLRVAYGQLKAQGLEKVERMRVVLGALAEVCDATGQPEQAAKWRAELAALQAATRPTTQHSGTGLPNGATTLPTTAPA